MSDEFEYKNNLIDVMTVGELMQKLQQFDKNLPVLATCTYRARMNEYFPVTPVLGELSEQNASGDPEFFGSGTIVLLR